ncbi:conjugal transfer protein [Paenibacillus vini]|uniref:conjugal transfer protein n=1 Tax=Paenibacillus vini TaxID=1476024 RepID=UPI0025B677AB|nr:conjugal transfer protein [Paenibacillus vini]MDN4067552.1 conjugal transfer protein [Paenibacillus vini]
MGLKKKKNVEPANPEEKKRKPDKSIKPKTPKSTIGKTVLRTLFWIFVGFIILKGAVSFAQGTRVIEKVTQVTNGEPAISDSIKGFAVDFATEYFTWTPNNGSERIARLERFIYGIDNDAGLKIFDVKGESHTLSAEVYNTLKLDDQHYDISVVIRREVKLANDAQELSDPNYIESSKENRVIKKTYMIVPITITDKGPLIQSYPRFVAEQQKGTSLQESKGSQITDLQTIKLSTELADSFLHAYFDGNASQLKYFYADGIKPPANISKSEFSVEKLSNVTVYKSNGPEAPSNNLFIEAQVIVKNDIGELFTNSWSLTATEKDGRLYVLSIGRPESNEDSSDTSESINTSDINLDDQSTPAVPDESGTTEMQSNQN